MLTARQRVKFLDVGNCNVDTRSKLIKLHQDLLKTKMTTKVKKAMALPIHFIFKMLQQKSRVLIELFETTEMKLEARILGFDEFMSLVLDDSVECYKDGSRKSVGRILLKGDNIMMIYQAETEE